MHQIRKRRKKSTQRPYNKQPPNTNKLNKKPPKNPTAKPKEGKQKQQQNSRGTAAPKKWHRKLAPNQRAYLLKPAAHPQTSRYLLFQHVYYGIT
jgi:hypothetical protein